MAQEFINIPLDNRDPSDTIFIKVSDIQCITGLHAEERHINGDEKQKITNYTFSVQVAGTTYEAVFYEIAWNEAKPKTKLKFHEYVKRLHLRIRSAWTNDCGWLNLTNPDSLI